MIPPRMRSLMAPDTLLGLALDDVLEGFEQAPIVEPWEPYATLPELSPEEKAEVVREWHAQLERDKYDDCEQRYRLLVARMVDAGKAERPASTPKPKPKIKLPRREPTVYERYPIASYVLRLERLVASGFEPHTARRLAQLQLVTRGGILG